MTYARPNRHASANARHVRNMQQGANAARLYEQTHYSEICANIRRALDRRDKDTGEGGQASHDDKESSHD